VFFFFLFRFLKSICRVIVEGIGVEAVIEEVEDTVAAEAGINVEIIATTIFIKIHRLP